MSQTISKTVYFKVDFEGIVKILRDEWQDWNFDWVLDTFDSLGLDRDSANKVINGTHKLVPFDDSGAESVLADDNEYRPEGKNCRFQRFVNPEVYIYGQRGKMILAEKTYEAVKADIVARYNDWNCEPYSIEAQRIIERLHNKYDKETWDLLGMEYPFYYAGGRTRPRTLCFDMNIIAPYIDPDWRYEPVQPALSRVANSPAESISKTNAHGLTDPGPIKDITKLDVEEYVARQIALDDLPLPKPVKIEDSESGYITPNGLYYPCGFMEHNWLALRIEDELEIPEEKLVRCALSQISKEPSVYFGGDDIEKLDAGELVTDKQKAKAMDYCLHYKVVDLPYWLEPEED